MSRRGTRKLVEEGESAEEQLRIRDQNRHALANVIDEFHGFKEHMEREMSQMHREISERQREFQASWSQLQQMQVATQDIPGIKNELQSVRGVADGIKRELQSMKGATKDMQHLKSELQSVQVATQDLQHLKSELESAKGATKDIDQIKRELRSVQGATKDFQHMKSELQSVQKAAQDIQRMQSDLQSVKGAARDVQGLRSNIEELRHGVQSSDTLTSLQAQTESVASEFAAFKKQVYDKGVLAPKVETPEDNADELPPVGTVTLGEDAFTARLLIHLGFLKARKDDFLQAGGDASTSRSAYSALPQSSDEEEELSEEIMEFIDDDNVHGITDMYVSEGGSGYHQVTTGWTLICITTFCLQVLVVLILIDGAEAAGDDCLKHKMPRFSFQWWLLHLSKGLAIVVAGILMGKELMDVLNMAMVSFLVEPNLNVQVMFFAFLRIALTGLIAFANVVIFKYLTQPANVWINMTALAFIGEIGTGMLEVARNGVFGHYMMKTMSSLNYELTFVKEYPGWFPLVRGVAISVAFIFVLGFAGYAFAAPDRVCPKESENAMLTLGGALPGLAAHIGGDSDGGSHTKRHH